MKIKGAELALFMQEAWPGDDFIWDHELFDDEPDPEAEYDTRDIEGLHWQNGRESDPTGGLGLPLDGLIRKWRKARSYNIVLLRVPKEGADPAHLPARNPAEIAAAAKVLLNDSVALDEIVKAIASNLAISPLLAIRVGLAFAADPSGVTVPDELRHPGTPDDRTRTFGTKTETDPTPEPS